MSRNSSCFPYIDEDVAYLLGLILATGRFKKGIDVTEILISDLTITGQSRLSGARPALGGIDMSRVRHRLDQLIQVDPIYILHKSRLKIRLALGNRGLALKNLYVLVGKSMRRSSLRIHPALMSAPKNLRRELLNALFAASGYMIPQDSNQNIRLRLRSSNLAKQITELLRSTVGVSVTASRKRNVLLVQGTTKAELQ